MPGLDARANLLKELTEAPGLPGYEHEIRAIFRRETNGFGEIEQDGIGSISCKKVGDDEGPSIMLAGHMDEVGWIVRHVSDDGFIKFSPLGGWWSQVMLAQRVNVYTRKGVFTGVIGSKPPHILPAAERGKVVEITDMYIDMGTTDGKVVTEEMGVRIGDPIVPQSAFEALGDGKVYVSKAFDNRMSVATVIETLRALQGEEHPNVVYGVGTVMEEVGLRGARTSSWIANPDVAFSLDVSIAGDVPGVDKHQATGKLGAGPVLLFYDNSIIPHLKLRDLVVETAESEGIPLQLDFVMGGTDGGAIHQHKSGVPTVTLCVPARHIHSHTSMIHRDDYDRLIQLLTTLIKKLDRDAVNALAY
ncbi:MAG: M42 family metallopeptidase [Candidatus Poribacteria bacterium]|nr:M42 family metallopeptidase [Candidatus Poribacteria bacterium]